MQNSVCSSCQKPKANLSCGLCQCALCKNCAQFVGADRFEFLESVPEDLRHATYCGACYDGKVMPHAVDYDAVMEQARDVAIYDKTQGKETRRMKRAQYPLEVKDCADAQEAQMKLAFLAVKAGFNALVDVQLLSEKVRNGSYQTLKWRGTGNPTLIEERRRR